MGKKTRNSNELNNILFYIIFTKSHKKKRETFPLIRREGSGLPWSKDKQEKFTLQT